MGKSSAERNADRRARYRRNIDRERERYKAYYRTHRDEVLAGYARKAGTAGPKMCQRCGVSQTPTRRHRYCAPCKEALDIERENDKRLRYPADWSKRPGYRPRQRSGTRLRGYGAHHVALRKLLKPMVDLGGVACVRCGLLIPPGGKGRCPAIRSSGRPCLKDHGAWHLDHDDEDRTRYLGPAHACCNVRAPKLKKVKKPAVSSRIW